MGARVGRRRRVDTSNIQMLNTLPQYEASAATNRRWFLTWHGRNAGFRVDTSCDTTDQPGEILSCDEDHRRLFSLFRRLALATGPVGESVRHLHQASESKTLRSMQVKEGACSSV